MTVKISHNNSLQCKQKMNKTKTTATHLILKSISPVHIGRTIRSVFKPRKHWLSISVNHNARTVHVIKFAKLLCSEEYNPTSRISTLTRIVQFCAEHRNGEQQHVVIVKI